MWSQSYTKVSQSSPKIVSNLCQGCFKVVSKLCQSCVNVVSNLSHCQLFHSCPKVVSQLPLCSKCCLSVVHLVSNWPQLLSKQFWNDAKRSPRKSKIFTRKNKMTRKEMFTSNLLVIVRELVHESLLVTSIRWCDQCDINDRPLCQLPPILKHIQIYKSRGARSFGRYIYMCLNTYSCAHQTIMSAVIFAIFIRLFLNSQNLII